MASAQYIGIIPARYGSTRLPGKPLLEIGGKSIIQHVYEKVRQSLDTVLVATDDERIYQHVLSFKGIPIMTRTDHVCGTDRCLEAYLHYKMDLPYGEVLSQYPNNWQSYCTSEDVVINIQGDEPFVSVQHINAIKNCFDSSLAPMPQIATLVCPFSQRDNWHSLSDPNAPKVLIKNKSSSQIVQVLMFSRSVIPFLRDVPQEEWIKKGVHYRHIGMYAYRANVLSAITQLQPSYLESLEKLEQLRWIENGYTMYAAVVDEYERGIDTPEDWQRAKEKINNCKI